MTVSRIAPRLALLFALAAFWPGLAAAEDLVVVEARGIAYAQGAVIDSTKPLKLKEGQHLTLISQAGVTLKLDGPYDQLPSASGGQGTDLSTKLAALAGGGQRFSEVGTTRSTTVAKLPSPWMLDIDRSGAVCLRSGDQTPVLWRASEATRSKVVIVPDDRSWRATIVWPAGQPHLRIVSEDVPIRPGMTYYVTLAGEQHAISVEDVPAALPMTACGRHGSRRRVATRKPRRCSERPMIPRSGTGAAAIRIGCPRPRRCPWLSLRVSLPCNPSATSRRWPMPNNSSAIARSARCRPTEPQEPDIVVVRGHRRYAGPASAYRSPVDRSFLAGLIEALGQASARDRHRFLLDQPTEPAKDAALWQTLHTVEVPLVVAIQRRSANGHPGTAGHAATLRARRDARLCDAWRRQPGVVRWIYPGKTGRDGRYVPGFVPALAARLGVPPTRKVIPIVWHGRPANGDPAFREFPAHAVAVLPASWFAGKIVLIGSDLSLTDRHRTPFDVTDPVQMAGVTIQAHALSQLIHGRYTPAVSGSSTSSSYSCARRWARSWGRSTFPSLLASAMVSASSCCSG